MDLQSDIVYGPLRSRRLGRSLGVNLTPYGRKSCNFNCAYCEYGWTDAPPKAHYPCVESVIEAVDAALALDPAVEAIAVGGNGEPTLHPAFARIAEGLARVRDRRAPHARLSIFSNASTLHRLDVAYSLAHFDVRCMKLDAGDATTFRIVNGAPITLGRLLADLSAIGDLTLQSMFVRDLEGVVDNTTPRAVDAWLGAVKRVGAKAVDLCTIARPPARGTLLRVPPSVLEGIAGRVRALGVDARVVA